MKWLTSVFLCMLAIPAAAQDPAQQLGKVETLAIGVQCGPSSPQAMLEEQFGEIPFVQGQAIVLGSRERVLSGVMKMYVNPETKTYSIEFNVNDE